LAQERRYSDCQLVELYTSVVTMMILLLGFAAASLMQEAKSLDLKERPVTKVINLLKEMQATLTKEAETDQDVYDKLACWCETNDKEKTAAIEVAEKRISELVSTIEQTAAKSSRLNTEIKALNEEIAKNQDALNKATAIREKELAEFNGEEKDMMQSIQALKNAVVVLGKHHEMPAESLVAVASIMKRHMHKHRLSSADKDVVTAFVQQPAGFQSYAPASGQIFGILKQMKETFEGNLSTAQKEELTAQESFASLKVAKLAEIDAAQKSVDNKSVELAETDEARAQAKEDLEDTRNALSADQTFLMDLKEKCRTTDAEWEERQKARQAEISGCSEAIAILSDDDAHDTFSKTLNFVQTAAVENKDKAARRNAVALLQAAAKKTGDLQLQALAATAGLDAFVKVIAAIDEMVVDLTQQQKDEVTHKDFCTDELNQNERQNMVATDEKGDLEAKIEMLASSIDALKTDIATLNSEIAESHVQIKRASEDRELENKEFQGTVADQRATQQILKKALDRLKVVYGFIQIKQEPGAASPAAPAGFSEYKKNAGAGGVLGMIQNIITDAAMMEKEAIQAEQDSQSAYESFVKNSNESVGAAQKQIVNKSENKAKAESEHTQANADHAATMTDLQNLANYAAEVHKSCDFVLDNFTARQEARGQEVEALRQAKSVLSGADFA